MDQWEAEGQFPAHKIFKLLGNAGFLGVNKPVGKEVFYRPAAALPAVTAGPGGGRLSLQDDGWSRSPDYRHLWD